MLPENIRSVHQQMKKFVPYLIAAGIVLTAQQSSSQVPSYDHVVVVIMENHDIDQIIGSSYAPFINSLIADSNCALFTDSHAMTHPSQPNYLYLYSGSNQGVFDNFVPQQFPFASPNLGASLRAKNFTFKGYAEDMPSIGFNESSYGLYERKHNPWVNWQGLGLNNIPAECNLPITYFPASYDSLPTVSFVVPNMENDMHNGPEDSIQIAVGDTWLKNNFNGYIQWAKNHHSLFILTFDENNFTAENHITTMFVGPQIKFGKYENPISHISVLRTLEKMFDVSRSGDDSLNCFIRNCWITAPVFCENTPDIPNEQFSLDQNYPNPFNPKTTIRYRVPSASEASHITLKIYDILGREIATLIDGYESSGPKMAEWDASHASSGIYFFTLHAGAYHETKRMLVLK